MEIIRASDVWYEYPRQGEEEEGQGDLAVRGVSLSVQKGEWLSIIGHNGSGKSTLLNTLKVNVGLSWVGVIMGEFLVSRAGLGYLIVYGSQVFNMDLVMTSVLLLLVAAVVMYRLVLWVEKILYHLLGVKA